MNPTPAPPLSWWGHVWRALLTLFINALAWLDIAQWQWHHDRTWFWTDLAVGTVVFGVVMVGRRRWPVPVNVLSVAAGVVSMSSGGSALLALVSLSTRRRWREIAPVAALGVVQALVFLTYDPVNSGNAVVSVTAIAAVTAVAVATGLYVGSRRELLATLRDRAERAEAEQAARVAQARTAERTRIAREMHDVLAHRISLVTMHAGALAYRTDLTPEQVRDTAGVIQENSHQALTELREVLGILRNEPGDAAPEMPQPSAADLEVLVGQARVSGMHIETQHDVDLSGLPELTGRTLYRIVQEALTNVRKHAPDTLVTLSSFGGPGYGLSYEVRNPLPVGQASWSTALPASGLGLVGLAERATIVGGRLTHEVTASREFVLRTWLPWPA